MAYKIVNASNNFRTVVFDKPTAQDFQDLYNDGWTQQGELQLHDGIARGLFFCADVPQPAPTFTPYVLEEDGMYSVFKSVGGPPKRVKGGLSWDQALQYFVTQGWDWRYGPPPSN